MKTPDKYRFTLQWGTDTGEKIQAGDFLESLGNRKSEIIVLAVTEYLSAHPEAITAGHKLQIVVQPSYTYEQLRTIVKAMLEEKLPELTQIVRMNGETEDKPAVNDADLDEMLKNLDFF